MSLSASALLYLGIDAFVPQHGRLSLGLDVPCRQSSVDLKTASGVLVAAAFWSLRHAGAVTIAPEMKKGMLGTKERVAVRRTGGGAPRSEAEAGLLEAIGDKSPYARDTVARWLGRDFDSPWGVAVGRVERELIDVGLLRRAEAKGLLGKLGAAGSGRVPVEADCDAIGAVRAEVDGFAAHWHGFLANEPQLAQALVKECRDGIDSRLDDD